MLQGPIFGNITNPLQQINPGGGYGELSEGGLINLLNNILRLMVAVAGIWAFLNLILAGYQFMSAGGDAKKVEEAWGKIWQSLVGLLIIVGSFVLAAIFGYLLFGDAAAILNPKIYGPGT
jgi:hypothetical protein